MVWSGLAPIIAPRFSNSVRVFSWNGSNRYCTPGFWSNNCPTKVDPLLNEATKSTNFLSRFKSIVNAGSCCQCIECARPFTCNFSNSRIAKYSISKYKVNMKLKRKARNSIDLNIISNQKRWNILNICRQAYCNVGTSWSDYVHGSSWSWNNTIQISKYNPPHWTQLHTGTRNTMFIFMGHDHKSR